MPFGPHPLTVCGTLCYSAFTGGKLLAEETIYEGYDIQTSA